MQKFQVHILHSAAFIYAAQRAEQDFLFKKSPLVFNNMLQYYIELKVIIKLIATHFPFNLSFEQYFDLLKIFETLT